MRMVSRLPVDKEVGWTQCQAASLRGVQAMKTFCVVCAWCKLIAKIGVRSTDISHGVCHACFDVLVQEGMVNARA